MLSSEEETDYVLDQGEPDGRDWLRITSRVLPVLALVAAGVMVWPSGDGDVNESALNGIAAVQTDVTSAPPPTGRRAEDGPVGVDADDPTRPELFVATAIDGEPDAAADAATSSTEIDVTASTTAPAQSGETVADGAPDRPAGSISASGETVASDTPTTTGNTGAPTSRPTTTTNPTTAPPSNGCGGDGRFELVFRDDFNGSSISNSWTRFNGDANRGFGYRRPQVGGTVRMEVDYVEVHRYCG